MPRFTSLILTSAAALALAACGGDKAASTPKAAPAADAPKSAQAPAMKPGIAVDAKKLAAVLDAQPEAVKARYEFRNPQATLEFFGIAPGMTVAEALPGGGWYTKILLPYIGETGQLYGIDYSYDMWPNFGFMTEERLIEKKTWATDWSAEARTWVDNGPAINAFTFSDMPSDVNGTVDAVLFIRALHNMSRFNDTGAFLDEGLATAYTALKPGGIMGIVQHRAPEGNDDAWAVGSAGYLKQSMVIAKAEAAGFELVASSEINANAKDTPTVDDIVWRLPPSGRGSDETKEARMAIGESDRMTLKFIKK